MLEVKSNGGVQRYSNKRYLIKPETVAEHCWYMVELALQLHQKIDFDLKDVIYRIMIHDLEEGVTLDIPRDVKHANPEYRQMTEDIAFGILRDNGIVTDQIIDDSKNAKSHDSLEGCIVHLLDVYQAWLKLRDEVELLGNRSLMTEYHHECTEYLIKVIDEISSLYPTYRQVLKSLI